MVTHGLKSNPRCTSFDCCDINVNNQQITTESYIKLACPYNYRTLGLFIAITVGIAAVISFNKHKTTVNPTKPETSSTIVSSGIYSFSRNPMYLAMLIALYRLLIICSI